MMPVAVAVLRVLDSMNAAAVRLVMYKITDPLKACADLAVLIIQQSDELSTAVSLLGKNQNLLEHFLRTLFGSRPPS